MPDPRKTGQWAREQLAEASEEKRELLAHVLEQSEQRALDAQKREQNSQKMVRWVFIGVGGFVLAVLLLVALLLDRQLGFSGLGIDVSTTTQEQGS